MPIDTWIKIWRAGFAISFFGATQFLVCCLVAIFMYPGGTIVDKKTNGYSLSENYVSDLGREVSLSRESNRSGSRIFNGSLVLFGICTLPFFFFMPTHAYDKVGWLTTAGICGAIACLALMIMGTNPCDTSPVTHAGAAFTWMVFTFLAASLHGICMLTSKEGISMGMSLVSVAVAMFAAAYFYHGTETAAAILFQREVPLKSVLLQKLVGISSLIWLFAFSAKLLLTTDFSEYYERNIAKETESYINDLSGRTLQEKHSKQEAEEPWVPKRK